jgi:hypothetical protein
MDWGNVSLIAPIAWSFALQQISRAFDTGITRNNQTPEERAPVMTRSRTAGLLDTHPIKNHSSYLPDPDVLSYVAAATRPEPGVLLRHLDQQEHLVYTPQFWKQKLTRNREGWKDLSLGVDQANYLTAMLRTESLPMARAEVGEVCHTGAPQHCEKLASS